MFWEILEIIGTIAFSASGTVVGIKKRLDVFGVGILAITTAVGGGIVRDTLLGNVPPLAFRNPTYIFISLAVALFVSFFVIPVVKNRTVILVCDALGLGAFTVTGASMALSYDNIMLIVALGVTTGVGGGVLRDIFVREIPQVFKNEIYAMASAIGAFAFYGMQLFIPPHYALYPAFFIVVAIRLTSMYYGIHLPRVRNANIMSDKKLIK